MSNKVRYEAATRNKDLGSDKFSLRKWKATEHWAQLSNQWCGTLRKQKVNWSLRHTWR